MFVEDRVSLLVPMHPTKWTGNRQRRTTSGMPRIINCMHDAGYVGKRVMGAACETGDPDLVLTEIAEIILLTTPACVRSS